MEEGEYKCHECNGTGTLDDNPIENNKYFYNCLVKCPICKGTGKLDWISNIIKPQNNGKMEVDITINPVKPVEMINFNLVIDKDGIVK